AAPSAGTSGCRRSSTGTGRCRCSSAFTRDPGPAILHHDGRHEARGRDEAPHAPATTVTGCAPNAEDRCGYGRTERHIEAIERIGEAVAERLEEGFLARPALEEAPRPITRIEPKVR